MGYISMWIMTFFSTTLLFPVFDQVLIGSNAKFSDNLIESRLYYVDLYTPPQKKGTLVLCSFNVFELSFHHVTTDLCKIFNYFSPWCFPHALQKYLFIIEDLGNIDKFFFLYLYFERLHNIPFYGYI